MSVTDAIDGAKKSVATLLGPFLALFAIALLLRYVAGIPIGEFALTWLQNLVGTPDSASFRFLQQTGILVLLPVVIFFLFLCLLILLRDSIRRIAQVLPPQIVFHRSTLTARLGSGPHTAALWNANPTLDVHQLLELVDLRVAQFIAEHPEHGQAVNQWTEDAATRMRAFDAWKVLAYLCLLCLLYRAFIGSSTEFALWHIGLVFLSLVTGALIALVHSLNCTYQAEATRMQPWNFPDDSWDGTPEVPLTRERDVALTSVAISRWWHWGTSKGVSPAHYWRLLRGNAIHLGDGVDR